jgi:pantothenate synthetase
MDEQHHRGNERDDEKMILMVRAGPFSWFPKTGATIPVQYKLVRGRLAMSKWPFPEVQMEGAYRPGFLPGVLTIVLKLLNLVRPHRAYFGEKDYQQLKVVTDMVQEFFIPTEIVPCATVREESGLAESSRNRLLPAEARAKAAGLFRALTTAHSAAEARAILEAQGFVVDYVEEHWGRRFAAAFLDGVRLIDNVPILGEAGLGDKPR